jgi:4-amino-4-deoxy-L-arabinose transferase-like glycosyltransferase
MNAPAQTVSSALAAPDAAPAMQAGARWFAAALCAVFVLQGLALIPYVGVQHDEVLFGSGIYQPVTAEASVRVARHALPVMEMSYVGSLKTWIYAGIFALWPPSPYSIRVPMLLVGALTIWLLFLFMKEAAGLRAAMAACALLAFDTTYLLTACFDWGPVAMQHATLMGGILLLWRSHRTGSVRQTGAGFFLLGLGLWDKALFVWMLGGLAIAVLVVFPREILAKITPARVGAAALGFLLGAAPLIGYNAANGMKTFRSNAHYSAEDLRQKVQVLRLGLEGSSLLGYVVRNEPAREAGKPSGSLENASVALSDALGQPRTGLLLVAGIAALALLPWLWATSARRPMLFALIFMAVTWAQMAFTKDAGGSTHHTVLMWPFPEFFIGVAFAQASKYAGRAGPVLLVAVVGMVSAADLAVTNQHLAQAIEDGTTTIWTDAIVPLQAYLEEHPAEAVYVMDWGILEPLRTLGRGRLPLRFGSDDVAGPDLDAAARDRIGRMLAEKDVIYVGHTDDNQVFPERNERMMAAAGAAGYRKRIVKMILDRHGRPIFEVYRWMRAPASGQ